MALILACSIGVLFASGIWLVLRPRTFQVSIGLLLMSYAVNLFIFITGGLAINQAPVIQANQAMTDPIPQALVLTAIVIGFATTALLLVVLLASRGATDTDHVDGQEEH